MASNWIKVEVITPDKPEIFKLAEILNIDPDAVLGKAIRFWVWADQQTIDGNADNVTDDENCNASSVTYSEQVKRRSNTAVITKSAIDRICFMSGFADALIQVGWLTKTHGFAVAAPVIAPVFAGTGGSTFQMKPRPVNKPFFTLLSQNRTNVICPLLAPVIARQFGSSIGHPVDQPSGTVTAGGGGKSQLVCPTLIQMGYGERPGQAPRVLDMQKPVGTVTAGGNKFAIASAFLAKHFGGNYIGPGAPLDGPAHTVTTTDHHVLVTAQLLVNNTGHPGGGADQPAHTVTTGNHHAIVTSNLVKLRGTCKDGQRTDQPMPTITAGGQHVGEVRTCLAVEHYDEARAALAADFLHQHGLSEFVQVEGVTYRIVDIGMRMLQPKELYAAQGFPAWYVIDRDYRGNKYAKDKQVARCGNAVPPQFAEALVRANLPEMCTRREAA